MSLVCLSLFLFTFPLFSLGLCRESEGSRAGLRQRTKKFAPVRRITRRGGKCGRSNVIENQQRDRLAASPSQSLPPRLSCSLAKKKNGDEGGKGKEKKVEEEKTRWAEDGGRGRRRRRETKKRTAQDGDQATNRASKRETRA